MKKILIITGASRGIGLGIAKAYRAKGFEVFNISRKTNPQLNKLGISQLSLDLYRIEQIEDIFNQIFSILKADEISKITLINNAGTLGHIGPLSQWNNEELMLTLQLNTVVPMICSKFFIQHCQNWCAEKSIINISSGAAQKPYYGWSGYCTSKAAINMFTQTLALEQTDFKILAIAPGVVDTDMQTQIRQSKVENFKDIERFITLKKNGKLFEINEVGEKIYSMDNRAEISSGSILRVE